MGRSSVNKWKCAKIYDAISNAIIDFDRKIIFKLMCKCVAE